MVRKRPKMTAPATNIKIMADDLRALAIASFKTAQESFPCIRVISIAPMQPTAAASVEVNQPANSPPSTSVKRAPISIIPFSERHLTDQLERTPAGPISGRRRQSSPIVAMNSTTRISPGTILARNRSRMANSACSAITISTELGGMMTPSVPPAATLPALSARL